MSNLFPNPAQLFRLNTAESLHPTKASDKGQVDDVKVINDTKSDTGMSDAILQRDRRQEKCFACGQWVGEHLQACAKCLSKLTVPYHALREAIEKLKNRSASEIPDQDPGAATQHLPTSTTRRKTVKEVTEEDREGGLRVQFPVAATSKDKLMKFLEFSYPDHYEIGVCDRPAPDQSLHADSAKVDAGPNRIQHFHKDSNAAHRASQHDIPVP